ncbi:hypothetical protein [Hymenobacter sp. CRA2]|uniref:hypothetical protein n=1 Tax=Hymenobacter sp. CRA2 TaxID=1955620 RepID=UPI00098E8F7D|nr:hypothetical protein [Hymenobacter sp. CRA2]OON70514.1 hypothetical protein B0919_00335 [Hymenobacter sp. CRA2]
MLALRRIVTVLVMIYLLLALLFAITTGARDAMMSITGNNNPADFWYVMMLIGAGLLLLQLLTENAHGMGLRRDITRHEAKVNELKAKLYDQQLEQRDRDIRTTATTVPRPEPAPGAIPRGAMTPPPASYTADDRPTDSGPHPTDRPLV